MAVKNQKMSSTLYILIEKKLVYIRAQFKYPELGTPYHWTSSIIQLGDKYLTV